MIEAVQQLEGSAEGPAVVPVSALRQIEKELPIAPVCPPAMVSNASRAVPRGGYWSAVVHGAARAPAAPPTAQLEGTVQEESRSIAFPCKRRFDAEPADGMAAVHSQLMDSLASRLKRLRQRDAAYEEWLLSEAIRGVPQC